MAGTNSSLAALARLGPARFVAFLEAADIDRMCKAVTFALEDLRRAGSGPESLFEPLAPPLRPQDGFYLRVVRQPGPRRFKIAFGYVAGGDAGDGGEWIVTYREDRTVESIESRSVMIF